jgi:hypothetical protein
MIALIDGDILAYRCAFAAEKTKYLVTRFEGEMWGPFDSYKDMKAYLAGQLFDYTIWSRKEVEPEEFAVQATQATLKSILNKLGTDTYELYLSGSHSFREGIATTRKYKGNRDGVAKPVHYSAVRECLLSEAGIVCEDGLEADDMLGIRATTLGSECVIVSIDKDLLQIPGRHFNWVSDQYTQVDLRRGSMALGCQILSGDPTDNVPGLEGIGNTKAAKLLEEATDIQSMCSRIWNAYLDRHHGDERSARQYLLEQGSLVYILRAKDDSFEKWYNKYAA